MASQTSGSAIATSTYTNNNNNNSTNSGMKSYASAAAAQPANTNTTSNSTSSSSSGSELVQTFKQKAAFMKTWRPASQPSNRDRLELYAWHKQAVHGDAPTNVLDQNNNTGSAGSWNAQDKAKYAAWRAKAGHSSESAMRQYLTESERQVRVYGSASTTNNNNGGSSTGTSPQLSATLQQQQQQQQQQSSRTNTTASTHSRGLAAIPLLCAAASEQRGAYLRRLQTTPTAWWRRQEPLAATPGSFAAVPETCLLTTAAVLERIALHFSPSIASSNNNNNTNNTNTNMANEPPAVLGCVIQSALWPLHNALLATWMALILWMTVTSAVIDLTKTVLLGSRRTGRTLAGLWQDDVVFGRTSVQTLTEAHQPVAARCVGLLLQPLALTVTVAEHVGANDSPNYLWRSIVFCGLNGFLLWWYWILLVPWVLVVPFLGTALGLGGCFALIELAAHV